MNSAARKTAARERRLDRLAALCGASLVFLVGLAVLPALLGLLWALVGLVFTF
jgi:hypothetical protein